MKLYFTMLFILGISTNLNDVYGSYEITREPYHIRLKRICGIPLTETWSFKTKCKYSKQILAEYNRLDKSIKLRRKLHK